MDVEFSHFTDLDYARDVLMALQLYYEMHWKLNVNAARAEFLRNFCQQFLESEALRGKPGGLRKFSSLLEGRSFSSWG